LNLLEVVALSTLVVASVCGLASGLTALLRRKVVLVSRQGLRWEHDGWRRRGWLHLSAAVVAGASAISIVVHSPVVDLAVMALALLYLLLTLSKRTVESPRNEPSS
jgi:hypothetical protein